LSRINTIHIYDATKEQKDRIQQQLIKFNDTKIPYNPQQPFLQINRCVKDGDEVVGGILAEMFWGVLTIDILWVKEDFRNRGYASALVTDVETIAKENNCKIAHLDTFDFQARGFYEKLEYTVFGVLEDCPEGHSRHYMSKKLV